MVLFNSLIEIGQTLVNYKLSLAVVAVAVGFYIMENRVHPFTGSDVLEPREGWFRSWFPYLRWVQSTPLKLKEAEEAFLKYIKTPSEGSYVSAGELDGRKSYIWTRKFMSKKKQKPGAAHLVMVHGMGAGLAMFSLNIDALTEHADVIAIDLPGFGRSTRTKFSSDHVEAEQQYVDMLEEWRKSMHLDKMNLMGHSFGGYLTASYSLQHPSRLQNAILVDPWGMPVRPDNYESKRRFPFWAKAIFSVAQNFNPLAGFRVSGPLGPGLVQRLRPDIIRKYKDLIEEENLNVIGDYLYHCNAHHPSGEAAFHSLMTGLAWAKRPMLPRLKERDQQVPLTVLFGSNSWITTIAQDSFKDSEVEQLDGLAGLFEEHGVENVSVHVVEEAGHHVYADQPQAFHHILQGALA